MQTMLESQTDFSLAASTLKPKKLIEEAVRVGAKAVALTDVCSVTGMIDFTTAAKKAGVRPIIGCKLRLVNDPTWRKPPKKEGKQKPPPEYFVTYYVLSEAGLRALYRLLTLANDEAHFYNNAKVSFDELLAELATLSSDDVAIALTSAYSVMAHPDATGLAGKFVAVLSASNVFVGLCPVNTPYFDTMNKRGVEMAIAHGLPTLVARPVCYKKGGADALEIMGSVYTNTRLDSMWHKSPHTRDLHAMTDKELMVECIDAARRLKGQRGMAGAGEAFSEGIKNGDKLVSMVNYEWVKQAPSLPKMAPDEYAAVVEKCKLGWKRRFSAPVFGHAPDKTELSSVYLPRLKYELGVLKKLGFSGYFLLTEDVVNHAKSKSIQVGPGRGSVGGSLVAYLLGITDCDPIRFGLLFERFINPDRLDLPDADLDFMSSRRHEIFDYLVKKYGKNRVAGVSNFNTLGPASAVRMISKAFGLDEVIYGNVSKQMPKKHGAHIPLVEAAEMVSDIGKFRDNYKPIWDVCLELEGVMNSLGSHAAGAIVGGVDLVERTAIERRKQGKAEEGQGLPHVVALDKRQVEDQGLIKMDILGLEALDLMALTVQYVKERHAKKINLLALPLDDAKVLENFALGRTVGTFQFESGGIRKLLRDLGSAGDMTFDDITAATALYRPGPMESGMMDSFSRRKSGKEAVTYDHPLLEQVLKDTYGVITYQEQVMKASRVLAGYTAPEADTLRKIIGKKLPEEMKKQRGKFIAGCVATIACEEEWAGGLFDKIEGFAGYGFNKSHATTYAMISYQAMWLKTYFPVEYFAACLTLMKEDKLEAILNDARTNYGIEIDFPEINLASDRFEILTDRKLMIPFHRIKGISDTAARDIVKARKDPVTGAHKRFASKADFIDRVNRRLINVRKVELLDLVGAFAAVEPAQLPSDAPSRIKDQKELIPGLVTSIVPIARDLAVEEQQQRELEKLYAQMLDSEAIMTDGMPVNPYIGKDASFVILFDAPSREEESENMFFMSRPSRRPYAAERVQESMDAAGVPVSMSYWTGLIRRPKAGKQVSAQEIDLYKPFLEKELAITKPPLIVLMGTATARYFIPDLKGKVSDRAGEVIYDEARDCNLIIGLNPGEIYHSPDKQDALTRVFERVAEILL